MNLVKVKNYLRTIIKTDEKIFKKLKGYNDRK